MYNYNNLYIVLVMQDGPYNWVIPLPMYIRTYVHILPLINYYWQIQYGHTYVYACMYLHTYVLRGVHGDDECSRDLPFDYKEEIMVCYGLHLPD